MCTLLLNALAPPLGRWDCGREEKVERVRGMCENAVEPPSIFLSWNWCLGLPIGTRCAGRGLGAPNIFLRALDKFLYIGVLGVSLILVPNPKITPVAFWEPFWAPGGDALTC
jgi:hypothetical protein